MTTKESSYTHFFPPKEVPYTGGHARPSRPAAPPPVPPNDYLTTTQREFPPKSSPFPVRQPPGSPTLRPPMPILYGATQYTDDYPPKRLPLGPPASHDEQPKVPFEGTTEYTDEFIPKEVAPDLPHLTGFRPAGIQLPLPRRSLGCEYWHKGNNHAQRSRRWVALLASRQSPLPSQTYSAALGEGAYQFKRFFLLPPLSTTNTASTHHENSNLTPSPGKTDQYFVLIPRHLDVPCSARQIFTTVNDNQEQATILVLYGDDPVASNNMLLGQVSGMDGRGNQAGNSCRCFAFQRPLCLRYGTLPPPLGVFFASKRVLP